MGETETKPWNAADYLTSKQDVIEYLDAALAENDPRLVTAALGDIARSKGMATVAAGSGLGRESLYKSMSETGNPEFATVLKVLNVFGVRLQVVPAQEHRSTEWFGETFDRPEPQLADDETLALAKRFVEIDRPDPQLAVEEELADLKLSIETEIAAAKIAAILAELDAARGAIDEARPSKTPSSR